MYNPFTSLATVVSMLLGFCGSGTGTAETTRMARGSNGMPPEYYGPSRACRQECRRTWKATRGGR